MSAGMATKVQTKAYFPGSMMDLNNGFCNGMWDPCRDDRNASYNSFYMSQTMDGHHGYQKEQMRQTILKQESIFRHQLQELHRVYKRQKDLMNELAMKDRYQFTVPVGAANSSSFSSQISSQMHTQRRVIDLELPADTYEENEGNQWVKNVHNSSVKRANNLAADLNEPVHTEEASFAAYVTNRNIDYCHEDLSRKRTLFGVELFESSHTTFFDSSRDQNTSSANHSHWIKPCEKDVFYGRKNHENCKNQLPHWLMETKGKETTVYQMNLDSLQQNSQQFFKKTEKLQTDNLHGITKILGVPITEQDKKEHILESRQVFDLNVSFEEEEDPSSAPKMEINLEADAVSMNADDEELVKSAAEAILSLSSYEPPPADAMLRWFAEVIASGDGLKSTVNVNKDEDCIPEDMDYFEYMTLNLEETKEEYGFGCNEAVEKEDDAGVFRKRATRKGQGKRGRQRKDFQRDVLPGIVSLSRREVNEDLQTFEEAFNDIGVCWQSKRKTGGKNGRGRRRLAVPTSPSTSLSPTPPSAAVVDVEKSVCRELGLEEKSLGGWGKRTRRLPRQRCQSGDNHHSVALKCSI